MKRSLILSILAILALATAFGPAAMADDGAAQASAKKKAKGKKKAQCKGKAKGKGSASASAKKKAKGKKKAQCKGKAKGKTKKSPSGPLPPQPQPQPGAAWPPADGNYLDSAHNIELSLSGGASQASVHFGGESGTCIVVLLAAGPSATSVSPSSLTVTPPEVVADHLPVFRFAMKVAFTLKPDLSYEAVIDSSSEGEGREPCNKPGTRFTGTLTKR